MTDDKPTDKTGNEPAPLLLAAVAIVPLSLSRGGLFLVSRRCPRGAYANRVFCPNAHGEARHQVPSGCGSGWEDAKARLRVLVYGDRDGLNVLIAPTFPCR